MDGAAWHGGGASATQEVRFGVSINYCRGWVPQQENQYLAVPPALAKTLPRPIRKMLGYDICEFVGYVDRSHPLQALGASLTDRARKGLPPCPTR